MKRFTKSGASWVLAALGILVGLVAIFVSGLAPVYGANEPAHLSLVACVCAFGFVILIPSVLALRNRRRAGIIFLAGAPIASTFLAYSGSAVHVPAADGGDFWFNPKIWAVLALELLYFVPFATALMAIRKRKLAILLFLISGAIVAVVFLIFRWIFQLLPSLAIVSAIFFFVGGFWLATSKLNWSPLIAGKPKSRTRQFAAAFFATVFVLIVGAATTVAFTLWQSTPRDMECGARSLFEQPQSGDHVVFTANLLHVGHSRLVSGKWVGSWAVGRIQERFWGWPSWAPNLVLLTDGYYWEGRTFFVDGNRARGLLTRLLPIVEARYCSQTSPAVESAVQLRLLHEASRPGMRIIGYARRPEPFVDSETESTSHEPYADAKIFITGSSGSTTVSTDREGIYEVSGLPLDDYTVKIELPDTQTADVRHLQKQWFVPGKISEADFNVFWNGTIEGRITDEHGQPVREFVTLQNPDGTDIKSVIPSIGWTDEQGFFRIERVPSGSYLLGINLIGPTSEYPYFQNYYPSAIRSKDARVLEIAKGQHLRNINLTVNRLSERDIRDITVRVTTPDGKPVSDASIKAAYEHTRSFESLDRAMSYGTTDPGGIAKIQLFGGFHVRVFASQTIEGEKNHYTLYRYSAPVDLEIDTLPEQLNLVVALSELPHRR